MSSSRDNTEKNSSEKSTQKKGRPTPTRRESEASRKVSALAPATSKAAKKREKDAARMARAHQRAAYLRGEENAMPARDKGPEKRFVRNYVDSHRHVGEYFLPIFGVVLIVSLIPVKLTAYIGTAIMYGMLIFAIVNGLILGKRIKREVGLRFPGKSTKGLAFYAFMRSTQMRRMRVPRPQVKIGDQV